MQKRVHPARRAFKFGRKIRIGLNEEAYAILLNLSRQAQRSLEGIVRAAIRDFLADTSSYDGFLVNQKRPRIVHLRLNEDMACHFADLAFDARCYGYRRYIGSIVEQFFRKYSFAALVQVFAAYADILESILKETS